MTQLFRWQGVVVSGVLLVALWSGGEARGATEARGLRPGLKIFPDLIGVQPQNRRA